MPVQSSSASASAALEQRFSALVEGFDGNPGETRKQLQALLVDDPARFLAAALPVLLGRATPARQYLLVLLCSNSLLPVCDPARLSLDDEIQIARALMQIDPLADIKLARRLAGCAESGAGGIDPAMAARALELLAAVSQKMRILSAALPSSEAADPARQYLPVLLLANGLEPLCDPERLSLDEEIRITRALMQIDPLLDTKLARRLSGSAKPGAGGLDGAKAERTLELLAAASEKRRVLPMLVQLMRHPNSRLRSKAALLVGRASQNVQTREQMKAEADPRVRANTIEALWGMDTPAARTALWEATLDPNNRVVGNALLGLYRLGDLTTIRLMLEMAQHPHPLFRSTAAWVMGETGDPRFLPALARMVREPDRKARHSAFRAISRLKTAVERAAADPRLQVEICQLKDLGEGKRLLTALISGADGAELRDLAPTCFVLSEDTRLIAEFAVEDVCAGDSIALGLVLPRPATDALGPAVEAMLERKRKPDRWSIAWYGASETASSGEAPAGAEPRLSLPLTDDPGALRKRMATTDSVFSGSTAAAQVLLGALANAGGSRHLLLIEDGGEQESEQPRLWNSMAIQAKTNAVSIHVLGLGADPSARAVDWCDRTGGLQLRAQGSEQLNERCSRLYLALLNRYQLSYRSSGEPAKALKLQIHSSRGSGECSFPL